MKLKMKAKEIYSVIGIGIGPFNLGLAALLHPVKEVSSLFFDQAIEFNWHPGLLLDNATLQTPFLCDCVSMADPTSPFSFLNFLKETDRLYKFFIRENFFILRKEYNLYCQWVAGLLTNCKFQHKVVSIEYRNDLYEVSVLNLKTGYIEIYYSEKLVLGTGTRPAMPEFVNPELMPKVIHTADYLFYKEEILNSASVSIIGSGQSAAEVFYDLLQDKNSDQALHWYTRPDRLFPMEYSKLTLELTSPDFVDYFFDMQPHKKKELLDRQKSQFKGINFDLINDIYDALYERSVGNKEIKVTIQPSSELKHIGQKTDGSYTLKFTEVDQGRTFETNSDFVILATGYKYYEPAFLKGINQYIDRNKDGLFNVKRNYSIDKEESRIFVQNAEVHSHSLISSDLGMGAYRNSYIINQLANREIYKVEQRIAFQNFGIEKISTPAGKKIEALI